MENVTLTPKEQARLQVLNSLLTEQNTSDQAAELLGASPRPARRMLTVYRDRGAASIAHGHRGRRPVNATPEAVIADVPHLAQTRYVGANRAHVKELLREREGILIQLDGSHHRWLGDGRPPFALLLAVDDATAGEVVNARFWDQEDSHHYLLLMRGLLRRYGIPLGLYTDRHPVFKHRAEYQPAGAPTQFGRAMGELGIQLIFALSPQAKGRAERTAGTFQDRLITELRLAGATTIEQAKAVLKQFLPRFNRRFRVPAQCPDPAFRPLPPGLRLEQILCFKHRRRVARGNTVKFQWHTLQLLPSQGRRSDAGAVVVVLRGLAGRLSVQHGALPSGCGIP